MLLAIAAWAATYARVALGPLQEAVKISLHLSDNQIALLQGMGSAIPLIIGPVPLGILADRVSRARMLTAFLALGLVSCVLSAFASSYELLFAARVLTGVSVAGVLLPAYAMAGDLFAPTERGRATMVMAIGEIGGAPAAFALGGALLVMMAGNEVGHQEPWRLSLLWMAAILIPVILLMLLIREPVRAGVKEKLPLRAIWPGLCRTRTVAIPLQIARAALFIADGAVYVWGAPLFARVHHLPPDRVGALMGVVLLAGGLLGPLLGGPLVDYCQRRGGTRQAVTAMAGIALLSVPAAALFPLMPDANLAALMLGFFLILGWTIAAAAMALILVVMPPELRGLHIGISIVVGSLFFVGLAPIAVSGLSGVLGGEAMIGRALAIVCATMSILNGLVLFIGRRNFPQLQNANAAAEPPRAEHAHS